MNKDKILACFKAGKGDWVSGEVLSRELNISRTAVWKHISRLRAEGYRIESSPKKGYLLEADTTMLLPFEVRNHLETCLLGRREIIHFLETDSTNARAKDLAEQGAVEGTLIIAETQTAGRGRKGRSWFSPPFDGLYISLILRPPISPGDAPKMTLLCAVAAARSLRDLTSMEVTIKWPNDVLVKGRKIAGILTELSAEQDGINHMAVGLGCNVNIRNFPRDIAEKATSVLLETGGVFSRVRLLSRYLKDLESCYALSRDEGFGPVLDEWRAFSLLRGKRVQVSFLKDRVEGVVEDIDDNGALIVKDDRGALRHLFSGDVELVL